jgi:hypothetical protein
LLERQQELKDKLSLVYFATPEQLETEWMEAGHDGKTEWVDMSIAERHDELFPQNSRDTGAKILDIIARTEKPLGLKDSLEFAKDSLFCEWAYVVDFDKNVFEVYEGFNKSPVDPGERFYFNGEMDKDYYPVRLRKSYSLDNLPSIVDFVEELEPRDSEEEPVAS